VSTIIKRLLTPGDTFIDGGANIGEVTLIAAHAVGAGGSVYSFEPIASVAARLRRNVSLNGFAQVTVIEDALSDRNGTQQIFIARQRFQDGSIHEGLGTLYASDTRKDDAGSVRLLRLDEFAKTNRLSALSGIKLDVEGAELPALRGAQETLATLRPWIVVEVNEETCRAAGYSHAAILQFLSSLGYHFFTIDAAGIPRRFSHLEAEQDILCLHDNHLSRLTELAAR
jgi:FkbM family methyltransferase